ncbi:hypothetical protein [Roseibium litorale]|uniref:Uncharacterized protein n=1 Tax=Roseibium litorale TaxID=2803841 RepID=A0ABR9CJ84_9HYPH|nr:hypothetical protein [Roseibium litorale]MBD8890901.1 hypothetical protein [Roseibium litorale]
MSAPVSPTSYSAIQDQIAGRLEASGLLKQGARIEAAPGNLTEAWLKTNSLPRQGAALIATGLLYGVRHEASGAQMHTLGLGLFLVPEIGKRERQASSLVDLTGVVVRWIDRNRFGLSGARQPSNLSARNLYSPTLDSRGTTLWQIEWRQEFHLFDAETGGEAGLVDV